MVHAKAHCMNRKVVLVVKAELCYGGSAPGVCSRLKAKKAQQNKTHLPARNRWGTGIMLLMQPCASELHE